MPSTAEVHEPPLWMSLILVAALPLPVVAKVANSGSLKIGLSRGTSPPSDALYRGG